MGHHEWLWLNSSCAGFAESTNVSNRPDVGGVSLMQSRRGRLSPTGQEQSALSIMLHCSIAAITVLASGSLANNHCETAGCFAHLGNELHCLHVCCACCDNLG